MMKVIPTGLQQQLVCVRGRHRKRTLARQQLVGLKILAS